MVRSSLKPYAFGLAAGVLAVLLRWALDPLMGDTLPLITLFGAVAAAVWVGGYRVAIPAVIIGYIACHYLFIQPRFGFNFSTAANIAGLVAYLFTSALIVFFGEAARVSHSRANQRR